MNGFVISVGGYVKPLLKEAKAAAQEIGKVEVDMGETECKVPLATEYIAKMEKAGRIGKKEEGDEVLADDLEGGDELFHGDADVAQDPTERAKSDFIVERHSDGEPLRVRGVTGSRFGSEA